MSEIYLSQQISHGMSCLSPLIQERSDCCLCLLPDVIATCVKRVILCCFYNIKETCNSPNDNMTERTTSSFKYISKTNKGVKRRIDSDIQINDGCFHIETSLIEMVSCEKCFEGVDLRSQPASPRSAVGSAQWLAGLPELSGKSA